MSEITIATIPIEQASVQQFCGLVTYAGEVAANLFFKGGKGITLQVGHCIQNPETHQETWVHGIDAARNELILRAVCDADPSGPSADVNPFLVPLWNPHNAKGGATSIKDALGDEKVAGLGVYVHPKDSFAVVIPSQAPMFMLAKCASSMFAICVAREIFTVPLQLLRGSEYVDMFTEFVKTEEMREVDEVKRDDKGNPIFHTVLDAGGKPEREPVLHPKTKRPVLTPEGDLKTQVKLVPETQRVMRPFEKIMQARREVKITPLYLQTELQGELTPEMFNGVSDAACSFDPTWMLPDVLAGKCKKLLPYQVRGTP